MDRDTCVFCRRRPRESRLIYREAALGELLFEKCNAHFRTAAYPRRASQFKTDIAGLPQCRQQCLMKNRLTYFSSHKTCVSSACKKLLSELQAAQETRKAINRAGFIVSRKAARADAKDHDLLQEQLENHDAIGSEMEAIVHGLLADSEQGEDEEEEEKEALLLLQVAQLEQDIAGLQSLEEEVGSLRKESRSVEAEMKRLRPFELEVSGA